MIRVLVADDQEMVRAGFRAILDTEPDIDVVAEAGDGGEAVFLARREHPDVVLMDIRMPGVDGLQATRELLSRDDVPSRVLVLTTFDSDDYVYEALHAGASGFLLKSSPPEHLVDGIRVIARGDSLLAPSVTRRVIEQYVRLPAHAPTPPPAVESLTDREREVMLLIAAGHSNAEIGAALFVSEPTVKTHVARLLMKLSLRDRVQVAIYAYEHGIVRPGASNTTLS